MFKKNQRWSVYTCRHWKAILFSPLLLLLFALSFSWHFESLSTSVSSSVFLLLSLTHRWHPRGPQTQRTEPQTVPSCSINPGLQAERCGCQRAENRGESPSDGLQWRGCPCLHCHTAQQDDTCQCGNLNMQESDRWHVSVHLHSYWNMWMWN